MRPANAASTPVDDRPRRDLLVDHLVAHGERSEIGTAEARVLANFEEFDGLVKKAEEAYSAGDFTSAALACAIASHVPVKRHAGVFWSPRLERILVGIGRKLEPDPASYVRAEGARGVKRVLHVGTQLAPVGGLTRMIARWIKADAKRVNSVVLTQQRGVVPDFFRKAVLDGGGDLHILNRRPGGLLGWALQLRAIARDYDLVVLHVHCEDVIPIIAFADQENAPPVVFLNHADHLFWIGVGISGVVFNLRDAAMDICIGRRGVIPERNVLVPTIIDPIVRRHSREEAKRLIGEDPDTVLLVSVARGAKYKTMNGISFADLHVDVLRRNPAAKLIVVGAGDPADWAAAKAAVDGRIVSLAETDDPSLYFEAADVYVDSYPFVSSTSMMEAAGYGNPLVTIFVAPHEAEIFAINHPGLKRASSVARSYGEYCEALSHLIVDPDLRRTKGEEARQDVAAFHVPPDWMGHLEAGYEAVTTLPIFDNEAFLLAQPDEQPSVGEPDRRHQDIVGSYEAATDVLKIYMGMVPFGHRVGIWKELASTREFRSPWEAFRCLWPGWILRVLKDR